MSTSVELNELKKLMKLSKSKRPVFGFSSLRTFSKIFSTTTVFSNRSWGNPSVSRTFISIPALPIFTLVKSSELLFFIWLLRSYDALASLFSVIDCYCELGSFVKFLAWDFYPLVSEDDEDDCQNFLTIVINDRLQYKLKILMNLQSLILNLCMYWLLWL